ncbi:MAG: hypothetical protein LKM36_10060 [Flavobacteriales bacterium]|jgi:hypothetical protein|nr:hypothetical protein [Flavobacteriales bacterium]
MAADRSWRLALLAFILPCALHAQSILQRVVQVHADHVRLSEALELVARDGHFKLSYNAALVNGDSVVSLDTDGTVKHALQQLVGKRVILKESGEHIILLAAGATKDPVLLRGQVLNAVDGSSVQQASVYELHEKHAVRTDASGGFALEASGRRDPTPLLLACKGYRDTVVYVARNTNPTRYTLRPEERLERLEVLCMNERCATVDELGLTRLLVPTAQIDQAANLGSGETRIWQVSLIPSVSTNGKIAGAVVNHFSFNVFAGYSRGLDGFELGGLANLERRDVKGAQVAGLANLVGRDTKGAQVAGLINHTLRSLEGVQVAGLVNTIWDTLTGVQVAGAVNVVKGGMLGLQVAGLGNLATQNCDGAQVSGAFNVAVKDVRKMQVAGAFNYGRNVSGAQVAGALNVARGAVGGGQIAGAMNVAREVTGGQIAGGMNFALDTVRGGQVAAFNVARVVLGSQVGIVNLSDTIAGMSVGIFSFARLGYHRFDVEYRDVMPLTLAFRTGTRGFYNVLSWSPQALNNGSQAYGYGFGSEPRIGKQGSLNIELTAEQINEGNDRIRALNLLNRFTLAYGHTFGKRVVLSAGPTFNLLISSWRDPETNANRSMLPPDNLIVDESNGRVVQKGWLGFRVGLGVRF